MKLGKMLSVGEVVEDSAPEDRMVTEPASQGMVAEPASEFTATESATEGAAGDAASAQDAVAVER